jgi:cytidylate kinase
MRAPTARQCTIAIDGPAASGKSTLGAALAKRLGYTFFDSGIVYRALTWLAIRRGIDVHHQGRLASLAREMDVQVLPPTSDDGRQYTVLVAGEDVTWQLRSPEVDGTVSAVSAHARVRQALTERLRAFAAGGGIVMVGRDIGTVVLPDADLKIYLTASQEERARRRLRQQDAQGEPSNYDVLLDELRRRDFIDSRRAAAPLRPAIDAVHLDSDRMTVDEEVEFVVSRLQRLEREGDGIGGSHPPTPPDPPVNETGAAAPSEFPA